MIDILLLFSLLLTIAGCLMLLTKVERLDESRQWFEDKQTAWLGSVGKRVDAVERRLDKMEREDDA